MVLKEDSNKANLSLSSNIVSLSLNNNNHRDKEMVTGMAEDMENMVVKIFSLLIYYAKDLKLRSFVL